MKEMPVILSVEVVAQTECFTIERVHLMFSNGNKRFYERTVSSRGAVVIIPVLQDDTLLLIREYGVGVEKYFLSFPKGAVDPGEAVIEAAQRELKEETGFGAAVLTPLAEFAPSPSYLSAMTHVYLAEELYEDPLQGDEPEPLELIKWPVSKIDELLAHPDFIESRSIAALIYLQGKYVDDRS